MSKPSTPDQVQDDQNKGELEAREGNLAPGKGSRVKDSAFKNEQKKIENENEKEKEAEKKDKE